MTGDLDVLVEPSAENAKRVVDALRAFGFGDVGLSAADFQQSDVVVQLDFPPQTHSLLPVTTGHRDTRARTPSRFG
ncbi:MAG: hypothetical protein ABIP93_19230 [Gemmatimonadaceae bacterium]